MIDRLLCLAVLLSASCAAAQTGSIPVPSITVQSMLVKNTLTALNHATITGNYTVLRDLGSTRLRQRKASDLADLFRGLRDHKIDLSQVLLREPQVTKGLLERSTGRLRLIGTVETAPRVARFDLTFSWENGGWMIDDLGLALDEPTPALVARPTPRVDPRVQQAAAWTPRRLPTAR